MTPDQITAIRRELGVTKGLAARLFGIDRRRYDRIEKGQIEPFNTLDRLLAVAHVPGVLPILEAMVAEEDAYAATHPAEDKSAPEEVSPAGSVSV